MQRIGEPLRTAEAFDPKINALRETGNRIPKGLEAGCPSAIAEICREYLSAKQESSDT